MPRTKILDPELESFIKTGYSRKYSKYKDNGFLKQLSIVYTIMDSSVTIEDVKNYKQLELHSHSSSEYSIHFNHKLGRLSLNYFIQEDEIVLKDITPL